MLSFTVFVLCSQVASDSRSSQLERRAAPRPEQEELLINRSKCTSVRHTFRRLRFGSSQEAPFWILTQRDVLYIWIGWVYLS